MTQPPTVHPIILPDWMEAEYAKRAARGKTIPDLIVRDLEEYRKIMKRREAKKESKIFRENEFERL